MPKAQTTQQERAAKLAANAKAQDAAITVGASLPATGMTEDARRAQGLDAGADAEPHDWSPEANPLGRGVGGSLDTYAAGARAEHPNLAGEGPELALGQAPVVPAYAMRGANSVGEKAHPDKPNAMNQSPVIRGVDRDDRNDPTHPDFKKADKNHPDYGKPIAEHRGVKVEAPSYEDLLREDEPKGSVEDEPKPSA